MNDWLAQLNDKEKRNKVATFSTLTFVIWCDPCVYICVAQSMWIVEDPYRNIIRVVAAVIRRVQKEKLPKIELTIFFLCILQWICWSHLSSIGTHVIMFPLRMHNATRLFWNFPRRRSTMKMNAAVVWHFICSKIHHTVKIRVFKSSRLRILLHIVMMVFSMLCIWLFFLLLFLT